MNPLFARVERFSRDEGLFRGVRGLLVAVSGGPDSLATLLCLRALQPRHGFTLTVAHFDHMLRPDSRADLDFVRAFCAGLDIPFLSGEGEVGEQAARQRRGIEEVARTMRYQFLGFVAGEKRLDAVVTGHTADDQAETVLMRVLRGSGVRGIRGMLPVSEVPGTAIRLVRPLLCLTHAETEAICTEASVEPRRDPTNDDLQATRSRLRHETLAAMEVVNPAARSALIALAANAREVFAGVERESFLVQPRVRGPIGSIFAAGPLARLQTEALLLVIEREASFARATVEVNRTRLQNLRQALTSGSGQVRFGDVVVEVSRGLVRVGPPAASSAVESRVLNVPGVTVASDWRIEVATGHLPAQAGSTVVRVGSEALKGALRFRSLAPGDRMVHHGMDRKVADLLAGARVPAWDRHAAVAIADAHRVHAILAPEATFEADGRDADPWYLRVSRATR